MPKRIRITIIITLAALLLAALFTAGGIDEFSYETAQYRYQYRVLRIPFSTQLTDTWITPFTEPATKIKWHKTKTTQSGKHIYTLAGQTGVRIIELELLMNESEAGSEANTLVAHWVVDQLQLIQHDPQMILIVRNRIDRITQTDRHWMDEPHIEQMNIDELVSYLNECSKDNEP